MTRDSIRVLAAEAPVWDVDSSAPFTEFELPDDVILLVSLAKLEV